ncbi:hypothetical protein DL93DRAFT_2134848 [Clavulina sp. PMI_390]|nr:hypothetical protein DL93DRAFT_2134848 [Clavulina sp. PMI_390]
MDGPSQHAMRARKIHKPRKERKKRVRAQSKAFHGDEAGYLYYQAVQLILRKQVVVLRREWKLPPEFEIICRDLWLLHLSSLERPPPSKPWRRVYLHEEDEVVEEIVGDGNPSEGDDSDHSTSFASGSKRKGKSRSSSSSSSTDDTDTARNDIEALLEELSDDQTQGSHGDQDNAEDPGSSTKNKKKRRKAWDPSRQKKYETLLSTIAILYVGCCVIKVPVTAMDFIQLVEAYTLPYLDATLVLPTELVQYLSFYKLRLIQRPFTPTTLELYEAAQRLARLSRSVYGVVIPDWNAAPLLWKATRGMLGSPVLYALAKGVCANTNTELSFYTHGSSIAGPPELILVSAVVCALKMVYGLDGRPRVPRDEDDPAFCVPTYEGYMRALKEHWDSRFKTERELFSAKTTLYVHTCSRIAYPQIQSNHHSPVMNLDDDELDAYIEFANRALLLETDGSTDGYRRPTEETGEQALRPGESIPVYARDDPTGAVPHAYELVLEVAAYWAGTSTEDVVQLVTLMDNKLARRARQDRFGAAKRARADKKAMKAAWVANQDDGSEAEDEDGDMRLEDDEDG